MSELLRAAWESRDHARADYSNFRVGAAIEAADGTVFGGCNVESSSYGLTMCAERVAVFKAISEGAREFRRVAVVTDTPSLTPPCGACRQVLWDFCGDIEVILANRTGETRTYRLTDLIPDAFDADRLR